MSAVSIGLAILTRFIPLLSSRLGILLHYTAVRLSQIRHSNGRMLVIISNVPEATVANIEGWKEWIQLNGAILTL